MTGTLLGSGRPPMPIMRAAARVWVRLTRVALDRTSGGMQFGDDDPTRLADRQMVLDLLKAIEVTEPEYVLDQFVRQRMLLHKEQVAVGREYSQPGRADIVSTERPAKAS